jgi:hypothetical protein
MPLEKTSLHRTVRRWQTGVKCSMTLFILLLAVVLLAGVGYLFATSPSRPAPLRDADEVTFQAAFPSG